MLCNNPGQVIHILSHCPERSRRVIHIGRPFDVRHRTITISTLEVLQVSTVRPMVKLVVPPRGILDYVWK